MSDLRPSLELASYALKKERQKLAFNANLYKHLGLAEYAPAALKYQKYQIAIDQIATLLEHIDVLKALVDASQSDYGQ